MTKSIKELTLKQATILCLIVYFFFSFTNILAKSLMQDYSIWQVQTTSSAITLLILSVYSIYKRGLKKAFYTKHVKWHAIRGALLAGNLFFMLYAVSRIPLADVYGLIFLNPIWLALLSFLLFKEHVPLMRWVAIITGFIGVLVVAGPRFSNLDIGMLAALSSGFFFACSALIIRRIGKDEPIAHFTIATSICILLLTTPFTFFNYIPPTAIDWVKLVGFSLISLVGILGIVTAFSRYSHPSVIAPIQYTQLIWASAMAWVIFDERPALHVYIGAALIIGAGIAIIKSGKNTSD